MNKERISISQIIFILFAILIIVYFSLTFNPVTPKVNNYYQVYLGGEKIGLIESDKKLYDLIDAEQKEIKEKYNVDKVYSPTGLEVHPVSTYNNNILTVQEIYDEIKDIDPFTILGYEVTIKYDNGEKKKLYILDKTVLDTAVKNTILAFISEEEYNNYLNGTQPEIIDEGREITDIYLESQVTIKKTYISTQEHIITQADELSMYFLFGSTDLEETYKVKGEDTLETIAYNHQMGVEDILIANPDLGGVNALLAIGQELNVAPIEPLSNIVIESFDTEFQTITYDTKVEFDNTLNGDQSYVKQQGSNGMSKVIYATKEMNGVILSSSLVSEEVITEKVDKIIVYGSKNVVYYGNTTYWAWPTSKPFRISSGYGYRTHPIKGKYHFHPAIDIAGTKSKNIYAIQSGTVTAAVKSGYNSGAGKYVKIDFGNGYVATYMHLAQVNVNKGDKVEKGQIIGIMGRTGSATGVHLHFQVQKNGQNINPFSLYK
ncbi:MAG: M23 family metallopeptidase [bacterium]|nr:M23 family metallopeptidase [bacterium]